MCRGAGGGGADELFTLPQFFEATHSALDLVRCGHSYERFLLPDHQAVTPGLDIHDLAQQANRNMPRVCIKQAVDENRLTVISWFTGKIH